jgi:hypothetical protein
VFYCNRNQCRNHSRRTADHPTVPQSPCVLCSRYIIAANISLLSQCISAISTHCRRNGLSRRCRFRD